MNSGLALSTLVLSAGLGLAGCSAPGQAPFGAGPAVLAELHRGGFVEVTPQAPLRSLLRLRPPSGDETAPQHLTVYLEGDGAAWWGGRWPPSDPTPKTSVAARLALQDPGAAVAYIGRPCQFLDAAALAGCDPALWTQARFGEQALTWTAQALTEVLASSQVSRVQLVGHSGGGVMASLLAERRPEVDCLVTLAAPLDTAAWTGMLMLEPLRASLNPADLPVAPQRLQEFHFWGARDAVVPAASVGRYAQRLSARQWEVVAALGHTSGWTEQWASLRRGTCLSML